MTSVEQTNDAHALDVLEHHVRGIEDRHEIEDLQRRYGYLLENRQNREVVELFVDDGWIEVGRRGRYVGKAGIHALLEVMGGGRPPVEDREISNALQMHGVVTVAEDGMTAKGRWRTLVQSLDPASAEAQVFFSEGVYENEYVNTSDGWRLQSVLFAPSWYQWLPGAETVEFDGGDVSTQLPPDEPPGSLINQNWSASTNRWLHKIDGSARTPGPQKRQEGAMTSDIEASDLAKRQADLERRVSQLESRQEIERLQKLYGYYIENRLWRETADLFAPEGSIEIGRRGRYVGRDRVDLFLHQVLGEGRDGFNPDEFISTIQLQGIVSVHEDGQRADGRWRTIIMASPPADAAEHSDRMLLSEGIYEMTYVRLPEGWRIESLVWAPTFYIQLPGYDTVWFDSAPQSTEHPPDEPSTQQPDPDLGRAFLPYHYRHPETGAAVALRMSSPRVQP